MFDFSSKGVNLTGGILRVPESTGNLKVGAGGVYINWHVEDLEKTAVVIEQAGGKMLSEVKEEGTSGLYRYFQDIEGNVGLVYQVVSLT